MLQLGNRYKSLSRYKDVHCEWPELVIKMIVTQSVRNHWTLVHVPDKWYFIDLFLCRCPFGTIPFAFRKVIYQVWSEPSKFSSSIHGQICRTVSQVTLHYLHVARMLKTCLREYLLGKVRWLEVICMTVGNAYFELHKDSRYRQEEYQDF